MAALSYAAALALAATCGAGEPPIAPEVLAGIWLGESGLRPHIISAPNKNGTRDWGGGQINEATLAEVGLTRETALDPCKNMAGSARYYRIISGYHTGPHGTFDPAYVKARLADIRRVQGEPALPVTIPDRPKITLADQTAVPSQDRIVAFVLPPERKH